MDNDERDIEKLNSDFYNASVGQFDKIPFSDILPDFFLKHASHVSNKSLLDIGSGPGAFAAWLSRQGYDVQCIEPAIRMAEKARERGLKVHTKTFQQFETVEKFDIIVAISSLIHIPKIEIPEQIGKIVGLLNPEGLFFVSMLVGETEGVGDPTQSGKMRYFSMYNEEEFRDLLSPFFILLDWRNISSRKMDKEFMLAACQKR
jgi:2-polyprenyl-3-methyl-5-hydroxy-6-metoxy-1,4-benzoquinol methylase